MLSRLNNKFKVPQRTLFLNKNLLNTEKPSFNVGIDLGTTNSCIVSIDDNKPVVITNPEGKRLTPSVVSYGDEIVVGDAAKRQALKDPENTFFETKRLMGLTHQELENLTELNEYYSKMPYKVFTNIEDQDDSKQKQDDEIAEAGIILGAPGIKGFEIQDITKEILNSLIHNFQEQSGGKINQAVFTVPVHFTQKQIAENEIAATLSGLDSMKMKTIEEPVAAIYAYFDIKKLKDAKIAVYDIGGNTFDVSIINIKKGDIFIRSSVGKDFYGGKHFDDIILERLTDQLKKDYDIDATTLKEQYPDSFQRLLEEANKIKHELSAQTNVEIMIPYLLMHNGMPVNLEASINRRDFERASFKLIKETKQYCEDALTDAKYTKEEIDHVILVGGMTKMPRIQEYIKTIFGKEPLVTIPPDEVVAIGAATFSEILGKQIDKANRKPEEKKDEFHYDKYQGIKDFYPFGYSLKLPGENKCQTMIPTHRMIPTKWAYVMTTTEDGQTSMEFEIYEGVDEDPSKNKLLGTLPFNYIKPMEAGRALIEVTWSINRYYRLVVEARCLGTNKESSIRFLKEPVSRLRECYEEELHKKIEWINDTIQDSLKEQRSTFKEAVKTEKGREEFFKYEEMKNFKHKDWVEELEDEYDELKAEWAMNENLERMKGIEYDKVWQKLQERSIETRVKWANFPDPTMIDGKGYDHFFLRQYYRPKSGNRRPGSLYWKNLEEKEDSIMSSLTKLTEMSIKNEKPEKKETKSNPFVEQLNKLNPFYKPKEPKEPTIEKETKSEKKQKYEEPKYEYLRKQIPVFGKELKRTYGHLDDLKKLRQYEKENKIIID